jgi:hypothetical protein
MSVSWSDCHADSTRRSYCGNLCRVESAERRCIQLRTFARAAPESAIARRWRWAPSSPGGAQNVAGAAYRLAPAMKVETIYMAWRSSEILARS